MLTKEAHETLGLLDGGAKFNCLSVVSRELITAGFAFDGWGYLEITESGRRHLRQGVYQVRNFAIGDPNISNMGDMNEPRFETPLDSHPTTEYANIFVEGRKGGENFIAPIVDPTTPRGIVGKDFPHQVMQVWSRDRAVKAAGEANGRSGLWVDEKWVACFLDAYEAIDG
jgi:hypothetical protein